MATADFDDDLDLYINNSQEDCIWGRLLPIGQHFKPIELTGNKYSFGRGEDCDYIFNDEKLMKQRNFLSYSKCHFVLSRESNANNDTFTYLEDCSTHGTFINGIKLGKNKRQILNNNDEISLLTKHMKVFLYTDQSEEGSYPLEITNKFIVSKLLGRGAYGEVRCIFDRTNSKSFAMKSIDKTVIKMEHGKLMNEVKLMKLFHHPGIVKLEDVIDTDSCLYIILELVRGGDLFDFINNSGQLSESVTKLIFYQIIHAVKYLHDKGITHRDLKPENVLLINEGEGNVFVKITDFGVSKFVDEHTCLKTITGTPMYCAPEIIHVCHGRKGSYTSAIDNWSLGVILYSCLAGYLPFSNDDDSDLTLAEKILIGKYTFPEKYWKHVSKQAVHLIKKFLTVDPEKRITLDDALAHPWLQDQKIIEKAKNLINSFDKNGSLNLVDEMDDSGLDSVAKRRKLDGSTDTSTTNSD